MVIVVVVVMVSPAIVPVVIVMVFVGPIAFVHVPSIGVVIPVRVDVGCAFIRSSVPEALMPAVTTLEWLPITL